MENFNFFLQQKLSLTSRKVYNEMGLIFSVPFLENYLQNIEFLGFLVLKISWKFLIQICMTKFQKI